MAHVFERAPSGRAKCRGCGTAIAKGEWRFGERLPNPFADGENVEMTHWFHLWCGAYRRPEPFLDAAGGGAAPAADGTPFDVSTLPALDALKAAAAEGIAHHRLPRLSTVERASSGRATCRACKTAIAKDSLRISLVFYEDGRFVPAGFVHFDCGPAYFETADLDARIRHFSPDFQA